MRLLFITQKMNSDDLVLGFVPRWIKAFSFKFEFISVLCLENGSADLPQNVSVFSLGKETKASRAVRIIRFYRYVWSLRHTYDGVFVHMNPEYVVLAGLFWRLWGKKIVLWYNHSQRSLRLRLAIALADVVCHTSPYSASAGTQRSVMMPVGVDTTLYSGGGVAKFARSILSLGRIAPIKRVDVIVRAVVSLLKQGISTQLTVVGDALPTHKQYADTIVSLAVEGITLRSGTGNLEEVLSLYRHHRFFVNASPAGLFDKTVFEAVLCGCIPVVSSAAFNPLFPPECFFKEGDSDSLAATLSVLLKKDERALDLLSISLRECITREHSLSVLADKIKTLYT